MSQRGERALISLENSKLSCWKVALTICNNSNNTFPMFPMTFIYINIVQSSQSLFANCDEYCLNYARNFAWCSCKLPFAIWPVERQGRRGWGSCTATAAVGCCRRHEPSKSEKPQKCKPNFQISLPHVSCCFHCVSCLCLCLCVCVCVCVTLCALCKLNLKLYAKRK